VDSPVVTVTVTVGVASAATGVRARVVLDAAATVAFMARESTLRNRVVLADLESDQAQIVA
jgi:hypothetical protein